jgi:hypothetical protein
MSYLSLKYLCLFAHYLRYLCLFAYNGVQHILCCGFVFHRPVFAISLFTNYFSIHIRKLVDNTLEYIFK